MLHREQWNKSKQGQVAIVEEAELEERKLKCVKMTSEDEQ